MYNVLHMDVLQFSFSIQILIQIAVSIFYLFFSLNATSVSRKIYSRKRSLQLIKPALFVRAAYDMLQYSYFICHFGSFPGWKLPENQPVMLPISPWQRNTPSFNFYFQKAEHVDLLGRRMAFVKSSLRDFYSKGLARILIN